MQSRLSAVKAAYNTQQRNSLHDRQRALKVARTNKPEQRETATVQSKLNGHSFAARAAIATKARG